MSTDAERSQVEIYTDGGADPNPGPGGWGAVIVSGLRIKEISGADPATTNNRMELTAAIAALRELKRPCQIVVHTDSQYLRRGITEWLPAWQAHAWRKARGGAVENADLWQELLQAAQPHAVEWRWVRGHHGNLFNERADHLATEARRSLRRGEVAAPIIASPRAAPVRHREELPPISLYARACALGQPGPGGYAAVLVRQDGGTQEATGSWPLASSNAMELWAVVAGLHALKQPSRITLYTTSRYVMDGATLWLASWESGGWLTRDGEPVKNRELWMELSRAMGDHDLTWVALSSRSRDAHSRRAAELARAAAEAVQS